MKNIRVGLFLAAATVGASMSAFGAAGTLAPPVKVTPLQVNVTYSTATPKLETYAGFTATGFTSVGTNTINDLTVTFEVSVTDSAEVLSLHLPDVYLANLPTTCKWPTTASNTVTITCKFKQFRSGATFPAFTVFYKVPEKVVNGIKDGPTDDYIRTKYTLLYAEGENDCNNGCANSKVVVQSDEAVLLGTEFPTIVISGVPQTKDGVKLFTGDGVPKNEENKKFTEELQIPPLPTSLLYANSLLLITKVAATDTTNGVQCGNLGNFTECPTYQTKVTEPTENGLAEVPVTFTVANPLKAIYRFDAATLKRAENQLFNNMDIRYVPDGVAYNPIDASTYKVVPKTCTNGQASTDGIPCVLSFKCYKPNEKTPDLPGDCELVTIGTRNGSLRIT